VYSVQYYKTTNMQAYSVGYIKIRNAKLQVIVLIRPKKVKLQFFMSYISVAAHGHLTSF
jgi:hypothetical protein